MGPQCPAVGTARCETQASEDCRRSLQIRRRPGTGARDAATRARRATSTYRSAPLPQPRQPPHQAPCSARPRLSECVLLARLSCPCVLDTCVQTRAEQAAACMDPRVTLPCLNCEDRNKCDRGTSTPETCIKNWGIVSGVADYCFEQCDDVSFPTHDFPVSCMRWAAAQECIPSADKYRQSRKGTQCSEGHSCTSARLEGNKVTCSTSG